MTSADDSSTSSLVAAVPNELGAVRDLTNELVGRHEHEVIVDLVVRHAVRAIPGADVVGLCLVDRSAAPVAWTVSEPVVESLGRAHPDHPLRSVLTTGAGYCCPDLTLERRWSAHAQDALERGMRGLVAVTSAGAPPSVGLVLYSRTPGVLNTQAVQTAALMSDLTRVALAGARRVAGLNRALRSRDVIGQAKGFLAHRDGLDPEEAFAKLVDASQHSNLKVIDVARWVIEQQAEDPSPS